MRVKRFLAVLFSFFLLLSAGSARAQVAESAVGSERHAWVGAEYSNFRPDYGLFRLNGYGFWGDYFITRRIGVEGEIRLLNVHPPYGGETEKNFLAGIIGNVYQYHKFNAYAKGLAGVGTFNFPNLGNGSYFAFALGGGGEYRFKPNWKVRGEYEYQIWPSAPGYALTAPRPSTGLTPTGFSAGIAYRFF